MSYSSKISKLNIEINHLNSVIREATGHRTELSSVRYNLLNKKEDLEFDRRWIDDPENGYERSRGMISSSHDDARKGIQSAYMNTPEQVQEMIAAINEERNRLKREIDSTHTLITSGRHRITTLKAKQRLLDQGRG